MLSNVPSLALWDENNKRRAMLAVHKNKTSFGLWDESGTTRAVLSVLKDMPGLSLHDKNDKPRAGLTLLENGSVVLGLYDENCNPIWSAP